MRPVRASFRRACAYFARGGERRSGAFYGRPRKIHENFRLRLALRRRFRGRLCHGAQKRQHHASLRLAHGRFSSRRNFACSALPFPFYQYSAFLPLLAFRAALLHSGRKHRRWRSSAAKKEKETLKKSCFGTIFFYFLLKPSCLKSKNMVLYI